MCPSLLKYLKILYTSTVLSKRSYKINPVSIFFNTLSEINTLWSPPLIINFDVPYISSNLLHTYFASYSFTWSSLVRNCWVRSSFLNKNQIKFAIQGITRFCADLFFYHNIKDNVRNLCEDLLTIENTDLDLKVHLLNYANELRVRARLLFQKLLQTRSACRINTEKNVWEKNDAYSLSKRVQTTINHLFFTTISTSKKMFFFQSASWKKHCATHWREQRGMDSYRQKST